MQFRRKGSIYTTDDCCPRIIRPRPRRLRPRMAITFDAANSSAATVVSVSIPLTIAAGANRLLVAQVSAFEGTGTGAVTSIVWNTSENLTQQILQRSTTSSMNYWTEIWTLVNPSAVASNVVFTFDGLQSGACGAVSYAGVAQTGTVRGTAGADGLSVTIASAVGDLVIGSVVSDGAPAVGAGQTQRWSDSDGLGDFGMASDEPGAVSVTHSYTTAGAASAVAAISVKSSTVEEGYPFRYHR